GLRDGRDEGIVPVTAVEDFAGFELAGGHDEHVVVAAVPVGFVTPRAGQQPIAAGTSEEDIVPALPHQRIVAVRASQAVVSGAACDVVVIVGPGDFVCTVSGEHAGRALPAQVDDVVLGARLHELVLGRSAGSQGQVVHVQRAVR